MSAFGGSRVGLRSSVAARAPLSVTCAYGTTPKVGGGKRWKHTEVNVNGNPVKVEMHIKKGDTVQVGSCFGMALTLYLCGSAHIAKLVRTPRAQFKSSCGMRAAHMHTGYRWQG